MTSRTAIRRLDHVAIAVRDTERALEFFAGHLALPVVSTEERTHPPVRLTYLDAGNALLQLVEPLDDDSPLAVQLSETGEGIHHICFAVDDVVAAAAELSVDDEAEVVLGGGRGRASAFVPGPRLHGVVIECTEFNRKEDVDENTGWLAQ